MKVVIVIFLLFQCLLASSPCHSQATGSIFQHARNGEMRELLDVLGPTPDPGQLQLALEAAITGNQLKVIRKLVRMGADINAKSSFENHLLINAIMFGHLEAARYLVKLGSDPHARGYRAVKHEIQIYWDWTALMCAARQGDLDLIKLLIHKGADLQASGWSTNQQVPETAADIAAYSGHLEVMQYFLKRGAIVSERSLFQAAARGHMETLSFLLDEGFDIDRLGPDGRTLLMEAAWWGEYEVVEFLLQRGADVNMTGKFGYTALSEAVTHVNQGVINQVQVVKLLLRHSADVNLHHGFHMTPLMRAVQANQPELIEVLVEHGAR